MPILRCIIVALKRVTVTKHNGCLLRSVLYFSRARSLAAPQFTQVAPKIQIRIQIQIQNLL